MIDLLVSGLLAIILSIIACYWIKSHYGRALLILLIITSWWNAIELKPSTVTASFDNVDDMIFGHIGSFVITGTIFYSWIVMLLLVLCSYLVTRNLKTTLKVSKVQTALEMIVMTIRSQIKEVSHDNPLPYMPIIGTFFLFIALSNLLTIIPGFQAPTASLSTTVGFAICVFFLMPIYGIRNAGIKGYLKKYIDPSPVMLPLNILSDFSSTFSLAFRLYGNMLSGAIIASVLTMLAPFVVPLPLQVLGLITGTIQAYIFALLSIVYVSSVGPEKPYIDDLEFYEYNA